MAHRCTWVRRGFGSIPEPAPTRVCLRVQTTETNVNSLEVINRKIADERDLAVTGFDLAEIDCLVGELSLNERGDPADEVPAPSAGSATSRTGDIWAIGGHRVICGDATLPDTYAALLAGEKAGMV